MSAHDPKRTFQTISHTSSSRATAEKQNEEVEKPDPDCGHSCSHVGPSGSPQNPLNSCNLFIASDDALAHQQFLCPRTSIELYRQSEEGKERRRPEENDPDPGQGRKLQQQSCDKQPRSNLRSKLTIGTM